jgi:hypothetical protein
MSLDLSDGIPLFAHTQGHVAALASMTWPVSAAADAPPCAGLVSLQGVRAECFSCNGGVPSVFCRVCVQCVPLGPTWPSQDILAEHVIHCLDVLGPSSSDQQPSG